MVKTRTVLDHSSMGACLVFLRGGRGVTQIHLITSIVVTAACPDSAFSLLAWWPRSDPSQHSHFCRGHRGVTPSSILISTVVALEGREPAFSLRSWCPRRNRTSILSSFVAEAEEPIQHPYFKRGDRGVPEPALLYLACWTRSARSRPVLSGSRNLLESCDGLITKSF